MVKVFQAILWMNTETCQIKITKTVLFYEIKTKTISCISSKKCKEMILVLIFFEIYLKSNYLGQFFLRFTLWKFK